MKCITCAHCNLIHVDGMPEYYECDIAGKTMYFPQYDDACGWWMEKTDGTA